MKRTTITLALKEGDKAVDGWGFEYLGIALVAHKWGKKWRVSEPITGLHLSAYDMSTRAKVIAATEARIDRVGLDRVKDTIARMKR